MPNNENSTTTSRRESYILTRLSVADPKPFESVQVLVNGSAVETEWQRSHDDGAHRASTDLSSALGRPISLFSLRLYFGRHPKKLFMKHEADILVDIQKHLSMVDIKEGETQTISKNYKKTVITITVQLSLAPSSSSIATHEGAMASESSLRPTTERITAVCPRFRILVIGNSGVGKSSLINMIFGLTGKEETAANVSDLKVGEADIEREIKPRENVRLVLHDSRGFEGGETDNAETVVRFVQSRRDKPELQDKLHAVWLCIQIPRSGGAVVEAGVENLLKKKASGELGDVPFIVVFTQYDRLISQVRYELKIQDNAAGTKLNDEDMNSKVFKRSEELFTANCLKPFQNKAQDTFPYVKVSTKAEYEDTVHKLVKLTVTKLESTLSLEPYITSVMAQRFSPDVKIQGSINVGRKQYWDILVWGTIFRGKKLKACLDVIHVDIVNVWNFNDPHCLLRSDEFKLSMDHMVHNFSQEQPTSASPTKTLSVGLSMVAAIAGILSALAGPAAPIVVPIATAVVLATWGREVYNDSDDTIRRFMAYIVDLTLIMQNLFWIIQAKKDQGPITIHMIELAYRVYMDSVNRAQVHKDIDDVVKQTNPLDRANRGNMVGKVEGLLQKYGIDGEPDMKTSLEASDLKALDQADGGGPQRWRMIEADRNRIRSQDE